MALSPAARRSYTPAQGGGPVIGGGCEPGERVRVTFRMATRVRHLVDESFDVLRGGAEAAGGGGGAAARGRPDVFLFEVRR